MTAVRENRWWVYQRERFPVMAHGVLIAAFSASAVCYSALLRDAGPPAVVALLVAFVVAFFGFLHLRIADEFKDFDEDAAFRPYRPVPRGLVRLCELGWIWVATGILQLVAALLLAPGLALILAGIWVYLALMSREFFVREWLKRHPIWYMTSHMAILPMIDFFATACDWYPAGGHPPGGLFLFVAASYANGFVIEIGRKIRAPDDEEKGVETYSALWGSSKAIAAWFAALLLSGLLATLAAIRIGFWIPLLGALLLLVIGSAAVALRFLKAPTTGGGQIFEKLSGVWTIALYLLLGVVPAVAHWLL